MQGGVRKRGNTWYYYFDIKTTDNKRKRIERKGGPTKSVAQKFLRKALTEYEETGTFVENSNICVSDYLDFWYKEYVELNCKYNTQLYYRQVIDNHLKPYFGMYKLEAITTSSINQFLNERFKMGYSTASLKRFYSILSKSIKMAIHPYGYIKDNPLINVILPKVKESLETEDSIKTISVEDFMKIIKRFPVESNFYIPLQIAFNTGMRASEVCALTWDNIDFNNSTISVEKILYKKKKEWCFGTPKSYSSYRKIRIGSTLCEILKNHRKYQLHNKETYKDYYTDSNFVCTRENGTNITPGSFIYLSRVINFELHISFTFHSLRHTHATLLLEQGSNIKDIQERLGHSNLSTTMEIYSHVTDKISKNTVSLFEDMIENM